MAVGRWQFGMHATFKSVIPNGVRDLMNRRRGSGLQCAVGSWQGRGESREDRSRQVGGREGGPIGLVKLIGPAAVLL